MSGFDCIEYWIAVKLAQCIPFILWLRMHTVHMAVLNRFICIVHLMKKQLLVQYSDFEYCNTCSIWPMQMYIFLSGMPFSLISLRTSWAGNWVLSYVYQSHKGERNAMSSLHILSIPWWTAVEFAFTRYIMKLRHLCSIKNMLCDCVIWCTYFYSGVLN